MKADLHQLALNPDDGDIEAIVDHLESSVLGTYHRNHSLIRLARDSFWHPESEHTVAQLGVFVHEYFHFLHNFSTVVGLYDFFVQLRLLRPFCNTVGSDGRSVGSDCLNDELRDEVANLYQWLQHLRGGGLSERVAKTINGRKIHPRLLSFRRVVDRLKLTSQLIPCTGVFAVFDAADLPLNTASFEVSIGSTVLMEGCACEVECMLAERFGGSAEAVRQRTPVYPYLTARAIFEAVADLRPSSKFMAAICVLALQSTDPGATLLEIAEAVSRVPKPLDEDSLLQVFIANTDSFFRQAIHHILSESLPAELDQFASRGHAGKGFRHMEQWCRALLTTRTNDRLFEIAAVDRMPDIEPIAEMLKTLPVCPVIQVIDAADNIEELLFFSELEPADGYISEIAGAQSLLHFSHAHLRVDGTIAEASDATRCSCYYVDVCKAPLAMENSPLCRSTPWESFSPTNIHGCWYAQGVIAGRGRRTA
ncbi:hypothetical protein C9I57_28130 [Trinickia symbiotica]|uniref:Uncharacterized protein n=1 Tax=Trinickia symbiotica TaxID=863227 RepID=A0A2T3XLK4_9BURK|nr:hypothetical protein [Trinickia symbiotica]PTB17385.1 hypothetical protein C9I57_28130 [Trinickia symbiotica]